MHRQLRQDWLSYQKCNTDVAGFCKKTKLTFRGAKYVTVAYNIPKILNPQIHSHVQVGMMTCGNAFYSNSMCVLGLLIISE